MLQKEDPPSPPMSYIYMQQIIIIYGSDYLNNPHLIHLGYELYINLHIGLFREQPKFNGLT